MKKIIVIFLVFIYTNNSFAYDEVRGLGLSKCKTFNNTSIDDKVLYMSWVAGYITSHNFLKDKLHAKNVNYNLSQSWLESFCYKNPDAVFKKAVDFFLKEFTK
ncbi:MAG: hypothetical protein VW837_03995 [Gammaproteobacteria bacterium]|jgi:hypothetical protein